MERVTRIELALSAWEADVLPLNYTRVVRALLYRIGRRRARTGVAALSQAAVFDSIAIYYFSVGPAGPGGLFARVTSNANRSAGILFPGWSSAYVS